MRRASTRLRVRGRRAAGRGVEGEEVASPSGMTERLAQRFWGSLGARKADVLVHLPGVARPSPVGLPRSKAGSGTPWCWASTARESRAAPTSRPRTPKPSPWRTSRSPGTSVPSGTRKLATCCRAWTPLSVRPAAAKPEVMPQLRSLSSTVSWTVGRCD